MRWFYTLGFIITTACGTANAATKQFMPDNDLYKYDKQQRTNITEPEFNQILDVIETTYKPIFSKFGATFNLERDWADSTVNAWANQSGKVWTVHMYGGMARRQEMNMAGFGLVACHEIGHHLGGFPLYSDSPWASNEGNSDYFANHVCAKKVFASLPVPVLPESVTKKCDAVWTEQADRETCYKALDGGLSLGKLLAVLGGQATPSYDTPDPTVVSKTSETHPKAQCRVDTYLAGSLCNKSFDDGVIPRDEGTFCDNRPKCWFKSSGGTDPNPTPTPNPNPGDGDIDTYTASLLNNYRLSLRIPDLKPSDKLQCAATMHAKDIGPVMKCSHIGTDNSAFRQRLRACGFMTSANEIVACNFDSAENAVKAWLRDRANKEVIVRWSYRHFGCSNNNGFYVCAIGI